MEERIKFLLSPEGTADNSQGRQPLGGKPQIPLSPEGAIEASTAPSRQTPSFYDLMPIALNNRRSVFGGKMFL
jgi:hypothetical protein